MSVRHSKPWSPKCSLFHQRAGLIGQHLLVLWIRSSLQYLLNILLVHSSVLVKQSLLTSTHLCKMPPETLSQNIRLRNILMLLPKHDPELPKRVLVLVVWVVVLCIQQTSHRQEAHDWEEWRSGHLGHFEVLESSRHFVLSQLGFGGQRPRRLISRTDVDATWAVSTTSIIWYDSAHLERWGASQCRRHELRGRIGCAGAGDTRRRTRESYSQGRRRFCRPSPSCFLSFKQIILRWSGIGMDGIVNVEETMKGEV